MRRTSCILFLLAVAFAAARPASAQARHPWENLMAMPVGSSVHLVAEGGVHTSCRIEKVTEDAIACTNRAPIARSTVKIVRRNRRALSGGVAYVFGGVASALVGLTAYAICDTHDYGLGCLVTTAAIAVAILVASPFIGVYTDFMGPIVYKRP